MFRKRWRNVILLESEADTARVSSEDLGGLVNEAGDIYPLSVELPRSRSFLGAVRRSIYYGKRGVFNILNLR